jgi:hypothetical protein
MSNCVECGRKMKRSRLCTPCWRNRVRASLGLEPFPKPLTREVSGVRSSDLDGLATSGASGASSAISSEGGGRPPKDGAEASSQSAGPNSQLPDGLTGAGKRPNEREVRITLHGNVAVIEGNIPLNEVITVSRKSELPASGQPINRNSRDVSS